MCTIITGGHASRGKSFSPATTACGSWCAKSDKPYGIFTSPNATRGASASCFVVGFSGRELLRLRRCDHLSGGVPARELQRHGDERQNPGNAQRRHMEAIAPATAIAPRRECPRPAPRCSSTRQTACARPAQETLARNTFHGSISLMAPSTSVKPTGAFIQAFTATTKMLLAAPMLLRRYRLQSAASATRDPSHTNRCREKSPRENAKPSRLNGIPMSGPASSMKVGHKRPSSKLSTVPDTALTANKMAVPRAQRLARSR